MKKQKLQSLLLSLDYKLEITQSRFLKPDDLNEFLMHLSSRFTVSQIGTSVNAYPLHSIKWGIGKTRVFLWSQMHGNESTTTRALINLLFLMDKHPSLFSEIYQELELLIIPLVNPDGSFVLSRYNANGVDLNRDAINLSEPESKILMNTYASFQPEYCLNLHGQRSIFSVKKKYAVMSFLAPSYNASQSINSSRKKSMGLVVQAARSLYANGLSGNIGRYDETFNKNCFGDYFQSRGSTTILVEAGQAQLDFNRDQSVYYSRLSLFSILESISKNFTDEDLVNEYYNIPMNEKLFSDLMVKNVYVNNGVFNIVARYDVRLTDNEIIYIPIVEKITEKLIPSHRLIDADFNSLTGVDQVAIQQIEIGEELPKLTINSVNFSLF